MATSDEAAARLDNTLESLEFGRRAEESTIGQPTAGGARPQAIVAERDRDGTIISERWYWLSQLTVMTAKYRQKCQN